MSDNKKYYYFYKITNLKNGNFYYGVHSTNNLDDGYMGSGAIIKSIIKKYGVEFLQKDIIKFFDSSEAMYAYEKMVVTNEMIQNPKCYNLTEGGIGYDINHFVPEYVKRKISSSIKGKPSMNKNKKFINKDTVNKLVYESEIEQYLSNGWKLGVYYSEESRKKLATNGFKGKKFTEEQRKKLSAAKKGKPANNKGIPLTEAQKQHLREINTGKKHTEATKQKIRNIHLGSKRSEETKRKQSIAAMGHTVTEETRQKISNANKGRFKGKKLSNDVIDRRLIANKKYIQQYGKRRCVTDGVVNKFIGENLLDEFLIKNPSFYLGITTKYKHN